MRDVILERSANDYDLLARISLLADFVLIGSRELAVLLGYSHEIVRQRRIPLPPMVSWSGRHRYRLGEVRKFILQGPPEPRPEPAVEKKAKPAGRPTKRQQVELRQLKGFDG